MDGLSVERSRTMKMFASNVPPGPVACGVAVFVYSSAVVSRVAGELDAVELTLIGSPSFAAAGSVRAIDAATAPAAVAPASLSMPRREATVFDAADGSASVERATSAGVATLAD